MAKKYHLGGYRLLYYIRIIFYCRVPVPIDREWYDALNKPEWTPSGGVIGAVWAVLFALISLSAAIIYAKYGFQKSHYHFGF